MIDADEDVLAATADVEATSQSVRESLRIHYSSVITVLAALEGNAVQTKKLLNSIRDKLGA
ncbi:MAG: hypothetical protein AAGG55_10465 [Pseudomonadota bacterium]